MLDLAPVSSPGMSESVPPRWVGIRAASCWDREHCASCLPYWVTGVVVRLETVGVGQGPFQGPQDDRQDPLDDWIPDRGSHHVLEDEMEHQTVPWA